MKWTGIAQTVPYLLPAAAHTFEAVFANNFNRGPALTKTVWIKPALAGFGVTLVAQHFVAATVADLIN